MLKIIICFFSVIILAFGLSGCDQAREKLADIISPKSEKQVLDAAAGFYASGLWQKAIEEGQLFASKPGEFQSPLALLIARAHAMSGGSEQALKFLALAAQSGVLDIPALMLDPAFESIRTDLRFVSLVAGIDQSALLPSAPSPATAPDVSVRVGPEGVSATAGGVSVRVAP